MISQFGYKRHRLFLWPCLLFLIYLPFSQYLDEFSCRLITGEASRFSPTSTALFIYKYGLIPGQLLFTVSLFFFIGSFLSSKMVLYRSAACYLILALLLGSLLTCNTILKKHWLRPRPKQVDLYGGCYPYCPILTQYHGPQERPLRSLPCGHSTMGFYFFALFFVGKRLRKQYLVTAGLAAGTFLGLLISWARMVQGGHFLSDIALSFLIMWTFEYWLDQIMARGKECV